MRQVGSIKNVADISSVDGDTDSSQAIKWLILVIFIRKTPKQSHTIARNFRPREGRRALDRRTRPSEDNPLFGQGGSMSGPTMDDTVFLVKRIL